MRLTFTQTKRIQNKLKLPSTIQVLMELEEEITQSTLHKQRVLLFPQRFTSKQRLTVRQPTIFPVEAVHSATCSLILIWMISLEIVPAHFPKALPVQVPSSAKMDILLPIITWSKMLPKSSSSCRMTIRSMTPKSSAAIPRRISRLSKSMRKPVCQRERWAIQIGSTWASGWWPSAIRSVSIAP